MNSGTMYGLRPSLLQILRSEAKLLVSAIALGLALALVFINVSERRYAVSMVLVPTEASSMAQKSIGGGLGSLASLAGVDLPGGGDSLNFDLLPDAIVSRETATELASDATLLRAAFPTLWNPTKKQWQEPTGTAYELKRTIKSFAATLLGMEHEAFKPPGPEDMQEFLAKRLTVSRDRKRPVITLAILHADTAFAKTLLQRAWLVTDRRMKETSWKRSTANIAYLSRRLVETQALDYRLYLYTVMSQEEKRRMTTSSSLPYVADPFGAPVASVRPVSPNIAFALLIGPLAALILALGVVVIRRRDEIAQILSPRHPDDVGLAI